MPAALVVALGCYNIGRERLVQPMDVVGAQAKTHPI